MNKIILDRSNIPLKVRLIEVNNLYSCFGREIKIIYLLKGNVSIAINEKEYRLISNDFILVNSCDFINLYNEYDENSVFLELSFDVDMIDGYYKNFSTSIFKCYSRDDSLNNDKYNEIRHYIAKILNISKEKEEKKNLLLLNFSIEFCLYIINNFKLEMTDSKRMIQTRGYLMKIMNFIQENYDDDTLNTEDISSYVNLSKRYTLKFFRENMRIGLIDYLNSLRLKKSLNELLYTKKSIIEIAINNGFKDGKSYNRLFKKEFNLTPGVYRKNYKETESFLDDSLELDENKNEIDVFLEKYLVLDTNFLKKETMESTTIEVNMETVQKRKINNYWKRIMSLGKASEGLKGDVQRQIKEIKSEINFEYIKFYGLLENEMYLYNIDSKGNVFYNFDYLDRLIDSFLDMNLKPFINLSTVPKKYVNKDKSIYLQNLNTNFYNDIGTWIDFVENLFSHFIERYGLNEVTKWYFEIWNNPDNQEFWNQSEEDFFIFYKKTVLTIKNIHKDIKIGGPSVFKGDSWKWIKNFINYILKNKLELDFFSYHDYKFLVPIIEEQYFEKYYKLDKILKDKTSIELSYLKLSKMLDKTEIIVSEWNLSVHHLDLIHDTCYMATFIIDTVLKNFNTVGAMVYWTFIENKINTKIFHGGLGLITCNNLKKAAYNAFLLLNKLGNECLSLGSNHIITSKNKSVQILLYNHVDYNESYEKERLQEQAEIYNYFPQHKSKELRLKLENFEPGKYTATKYYLNRKSGSVYDAWLRMGSPQKITEEIYELLKLEEKMKIRIESLEIENTLIIQENLDVHEIIFINIQKNE